MLIHPPPGMEEDNGYGASDAMTDVVWFFAIINLCLMVIFAQVQQMSTEKGPFLEPPPLHSADILKSQVDALLAKKKALETQAAKMAALLEKMGFDLEEKKRLGQATVEAIQLDEKAFREAMERMAWIQHQLKREEGRLARINKVLAGKERRLQEMDEEIRRSRMELEVMQRTMAELRKELATLKNQNPVEVDDPPTPDPPTPDPPPPGPVGFTLNFHSKAAMLQLLENGLVDLYMEMKSTKGSRVWKLGRDGGKGWMFTSNPGASTHDIPRELIPQAILQAQESTVAAFGKNAVIYGVHLPESIGEQIRVFMNDGRLGGKMVIMGDGKVVID